MDDNKGVLSSILLGLSFLVGVFVLFALVMFGATWVSSKVLPALNLTSVLLIPIALLLLVPLGFFRPTRRFAGVGLLVSSYVFGITLWMSGLIVTMQLWGLAALVIGLIMGGVGVVPIGFLAALFHGEWRALLNILFLAVLTLGSRGIAVLRIARADEERLEQRHPAPSSRAAAVS